MSYIGVTVVQRQIYLLKMVAVGVGSEILKLLLMHEECLLILWPREGVVIELYTR